MEGARQNGVSGSLIVDEAVRWGDVLGMVARTQVDGTSTTERQRVDVLELAAQTAKCRVPFATMMGYLSDDERRILRREEVRTRENQTITCYTLGHDAVGLVLNKWKVQRAEAKARTRRATFSMTVVGVMITVASLGYMLVRGGLHQRGRLAFCGLRCRFLRVRLADDAHQILDLQPRVLEIVCAIPTPDVGLTLERVAKGRVFPRARSNRS